MKIWIDRELFQWERKRTVNISCDAGDPEVTFVQFYNEKESFGPEVLLEEGKAEIPDILLTSCTPIMAVACTGKPGEGQVVGRKQFKVVKRVRPESYPDPGRHVIYDGGEEV